MCISIYVAEVISRYFQDNNLWQDKVNENLIIIEYRKKILSVCSLSPFNFAFV